MSEPSAAFKDFRADVRFLAACFKANQQLVQWPPTEEQRAKYRYPYNNDRLDRAIENLWEQVHFAFLFDGESQAGRVPVESHKLDTVGSTPTPATITIPETVTATTINQTDLSKWAYSGQSASSRAFTNRITTDGKPIAEV